MGSNTSGIIMVEPHSTTWMWKERLIYFAVVFVGVFIHIVEIFATPMQIRKGIQISHHKLYDYSFFHSL